MRIGMSELVVVFLVALVVIGPDKLPRYAKKLGEALAVFRKATDEATEEIKKNVVDPLEEAQRPLREAMEPVEDLDKAVRGNVREVRSSLNNIGRKPAAQSAPKADGAKGAAAAPTSVSAAETGDTPAADGAAETSNTPAADSAEGAEGLPAEDVADGGASHAPSPEPPPASSAPEPPAPSGAAE